MELLQLRDFRAVVETGSINGAAKKLGLTQPPVSMSATSAICVRQRSRLCSGREMA